MLQREIQAVPGARGRSAALWQGGLLFAAYLIAAVAGLQWAQVQGAGSPIWPAFGFSMAGLLLGGIRLWPAIVLGRLAAGIIVGSNQPLWAELVIALCNGLADVCAVALLLHFGGIRRYMSRLTDVWRLALAVGISAALSASIGAWCLQVSSGLTLHQTLDLWTAWWFANLVAGLTITPFILTMTVRSERQHFVDAPLTTVLCFGAVVLASRMIFIEPLQAGFHSWHIYPLLIWAALSFGTSGAAGALVIVSAFATAGAALHQGPFAIGSDDPVRTVMLMQQFVAVTGLTMLLLAAVANERRGKLAMISKNSKLKAANRLLAEALSTEEVLTYEINHRVKNSLQLVGSMLWLQSRHTSVPGAQQVLEEARRRIGVVAAIHQALYAQGPHTNVRMAQVLGTMAAEALRTDQINAHIDWHAEVEDIELPINRAVAFALIVNELLSNTLKYAFPGGAGGRVVMTLASYEGRATFTLADEGQALPASFDPATSQGVGLRIVRALLDQLQGELSVERRLFGAAFILAFSLQGG